MDKIVTPNDLIEFFKKVFSNRNEDDVFFYIGLWMADRPGEYKTETDDDGNEYITDESLQDLAKYLTLWFAFNDLVADLQSQI